MSNPVSTPPLQTFKNLPLQELKAKIQQVYNFYGKAPKVEVRGQLIDDESGLEIQEEGRGPLVGTWGSRLRMTVNDQIRLVQLGTGEHEYLFYPPEIS